MTTRVEINPNLRLENDYTIVDLDEDVDGPVPQELEVVQVYERQSGMVGRAWVHRVDTAERTITLFVEWASLTIPSTASGILASGTSNYVFGGTHRHPAGISGSRVRSSGSGHPSIAEQLEVV